MLLRIAAWCCAAFLAAVPASAGVETGAIADANAPATDIAIDIPLAVTAATPDPLQANLPQAGITKPEDATVTPAEQRPVTAAPVEASIPVADPPAIQANVQASVQVGTPLDVPQQDHNERNAPAKFAALEAPVNAPPAEALPHLEKPGTDLPHIDASFRFNILPVKGGDVLVKWNGVKAAMRAESEVFARCRQNMNACPKGAKSFLAIVDEGRSLSGRARIGVINRAINMAIEPVSDMAQWGVPDRWSAPFETFTTGKGDCEDYAIAKYVALGEAGIAADDIKLMIVRNTAANEDHAVTAVRLDGTWIILDNRWLKMVEDAAMSQAVPLFSLGSEGVRRFLPDVLVGERRPPPAPASIAD
jgi:predicted transglutaminase-like cysteine proteinase